MPRAAQTGDHVSLRTDPSRSVAIIGMACRFPGAADTPAAFWDLLTEGRSAVGTIPSDRMDVDRLCGESAGRITSQYGGYLDAIDQFDAGFFHVSPREAARMDPQQRLILETGWEAMEDGGLPAAQLSGRRVGVYVGQWLSDFETRLLADPEITDFEMTVGSGRYTTAGRLSHLLNLQGPSLTLDTACASSLTAVHLAVQSLRSAECDMAFAGGVNVILNPHITVAYSGAGMMAPDGRCKFCDAGADGYVRSEGAGMLLLKRLDRALEDGDRIHAVIRGSAINNDGDTSGSFGRPSRAGQQALIAAAVADAGVAPSEVGYVEAHGTGTRTGDPEELAALAAVLGPGRAAPLRVGSVKTNIGHTEGAAGIAGLIKAVMATKTGTIPASLNYETPTPAFDWASEPVEVAAARVDWKDEQRIAGVSGFGIAGSNAHVVVQNAPMPAKEPASEGHLRVPVLPISADSDAALRALALRHAERIDALADTSLAGYCAAAASRRSALGFRAAFAGSDRARLVAALRTFGEGGPAATTGRAPTQGAPRVIMVAPGQGGQWTGMARRLLERESVFRDAITECEEALADLVDWSLTEQIALDKGAPGWRLDRIDVIQPTLAALAIGYARLWSALDLQPAGVIGHSMGEVAAAAVSGRLSVSDAMRVVVNRSALMARTSGQGGMALVELVGEALDQRLAPHAGALCVGAYNSPRTSVVSGETGALEKLLCDLEKDGIFRRRIRVDVASHGPQMAALSGALSTALQVIKPQTATLPMYSTVTGRPADGQSLDAGYWARNLCDPVRFIDAVGAALDEGPAAFVELGPNPVLLTSIEQILDARDLPAVLAASERRDRPAEEVIAESIAGLWVAGVEVNWAAYAPAPSGEVPLPLYPWQRERHWHEAAELRPRSAARAVPQLPEETRVLLHEIHWEEAPAPGDAEVAGDWIVLGPDMDACEAIAAELPGARSATLGEAPKVLAETRAAGVIVIAPEADAGFLPVQILQTLRQGAMSGLRLVFVTQGAVLTGDGQDTIATGQAPLIGAARVVAEEHPELAIRMVDADPALPLAASAKLIAARALSSDPEPEMALRGESWFRPRLHEMRDMPALRPGFSLRTDGAYLVTGGLSALGLRAASTLVRAGARHIVLLSRRPLPPRAEWRQAAERPETAARISGVLALEAAGATIETAAVDVVDAGAMSAWIDARDAEIRPAIAGVVHLATGYDTRLALDTEQADFTRAIEAKLTGAAVLDRLFPELDLFVLYSSTMTFLPHQGLAGYAAANCGLDALAADRRARGQHALSVAWGPWKGLGRARLDHVADEFEARGELSLEAAEGDALLGHLLSRDFGATVSCVRMDWPRYAAERAGRPLQLFSGLIPQEGRTATDPTFADLSGPERRAAAERFVPEAIARVLSLGTALPDLDRPLGHLGLNSLMAIELRNALEKSVGWPLSATLAWSYPTARALIGHLADDASEAIASVRPAATMDQQDDLSRGLAEVAEMSDEEALEALMGGAL